ncbi:MAG: hypothetical protein MRJ68_02110 [Nitrospira sp.]|nr:hypothetical protein [Nitrospira sp.]
MSSRLPHSVENYRDPHDRVIVVKLPEHEYRSARSMARACRVPVSALVRGLILRTVERHKQLAGNTEESS